MVVMRWKSTKKSLLQPGKLLVGGEEEAEGTLGAEEETPEVAGDNHSVEASVWIGIEVVLIAEAVVSVSQVEGVEAVEASQGVAEEEVSRAAVDQEVVADFQEAAEAARREVVEASQEVEGVGLVAAPDKGTSCLSV